MSSTFETIETTVVQTVAGLTSGGSDLLATVQGRTFRDRKTLLAALARERLPAAYVMLTGRDAGEKSTRRAGVPAVSVWLAAGSQRSDDDARTGATDVTGVFDVAEQVAGALQDLAIGADRRLLMVDERPVGGDEGLIVWEQRYEVRRLAELTDPTFGGTTLAGSDSEIRVELGSLRSASSSFSFPGIDGVFQRHLGSRERPIVWRGQLRAASDSALDTIESAIEDELRGGEAKTMVDAWGRSHGSCVLSSFERRSERRRDALSGEALQDVAITFVQLAG